MMEAPFFYNRKRLTNQNVKDYLTKKHAGFSVISSKAYKRLGVDNLLQKNYGKDMDCSLTSITECTMYHYIASQNTQKPEKLNADEVYNYVEETAKKYFYNGDTFGTIPVFIKNIYDKTLEHFGLKAKTKQKYFKNVGYSLGSIMKTIDEGRPVIINIFRDGRDYYNNHSVTIVGYETFELHNFDTKITKQVTMLIVQDHWLKVNSYVDFEFISCISAINY